MSRTLTWRVGAWLAIIAVVAGGTACGDSQPPDTASSTSPVGPGTFAAGARDSSTPPAVRRLPERLRAELALFRSSPEGLPIQVKQALRDHSTNGLNWSLAQRVPRAPWRAWIVPGRVLHLGLLPGLQASRLVPRDHQEQQHHQCRDIRRRGDLL